LEAETRHFGEPARQAAHTAHVSQRPTGPSYLAPGGAAPLQAQTTRSLQATGRKRKVILVGLILLVLLLAPLVLLMIFKIIKGRSAAAEPPVASAPEKPGRGGTTSTDNSLVYPGAETVMDMTSKDGERVLQLRTKDSLDKVVAWYVEKLKPTENMKIPGENVTVLRGDDIRAVITATDNQTDIIIRQGDE
jgi:hypothetical protein